MRRQRSLQNGRWALAVLHGTALPQWGQLTRRGLSVPLTMRLSAMQWRDPRLLETLKQILEETGLPASMLQLAMREGVLFDPKFSTNLLTQMKESGFRLAIH
mgnify:CR=1 FL=1